MKLQVPSSSEQQHSRLGLPFLLAGCGGDGGKCRTTELARTDVKVQRPRKAGRKGDARAHGLSVLTLLLWCQPSNAAFRGKLHFSWSQTLSIHSFVHRIFPESTIVPPKHALAHPNLTLDFFLSGTHDTSTFAVERDGSGACLPAFYPPLISKNGFGCHQGTESPVQCSALLAHRAKTWPG